MCREEHGVGIPRGRWERECGRGGVGKREGRKAAYVFYVCSGRLSGTKAQQRSSYCIICPSTAPSSYSLDLLPPFSSSWLAFLPTRPLSPSSPLLLPAESLEAEINQSVR